MSITRCQSNQSNCNRMDYFHWTRAFVHMHVPCAAFFTVIDSWSLFKFIRFKIACIYLLILKCHQNRFPSFENEMKYEMNIDLLIKWQWLIPSVHSVDARGNFHIFSSLCSIVHNDSLSLSLHSIGPDLSPQFKKFSVFKSLSKRGRESVRSKKWKIKTNNR